MLKGKSIVLGVTGCIAAYKACEIVSRLNKLGATVDVIMTKNACEFVTPLTFENLSRRRVVVDMFDRSFEYQTEHVSLAKAADVFLVAPATANVIAKLANGIADDMLTTTFLATKRAIKVVCPAMNPDMLINPQTEMNIENLKAKGIYVMDAAVGRVACGDEGKGRLPEPVDIVEYVEKLLQPNADLKGKTVLVTAGATEENIDGVRFLTNRSSGKMGIAICEAAAERGANVLLAAGRLSVSVPDCVSKTVRAESTEGLKQAVLSLLPEADIVIMAAAPSDYRLEKPFSAKQKGEKLTLELVKNPDIAAEVGKIKGDKKLVIFAAETEDLTANAKAKLAKKNADLVIANDVTMEGAGFDVDTNIATVIGADGQLTRLPKMTKRALADIILDKAVDL